MGTQPIVTSFNRREHLEDSCRRAGLALDTYSPGDGVYLFTDGVTEANNAAEELFGETRLEAVLRAADGAPCAEIVKSVAYAVRAFVGDALPSDDITMLAIRRLDPLAL